MKHFNFLKNLFQKIENRNKLSQFLVLLSFLLTFGIVRTVTHLQKAEFLPQQGFDLHIHHLVPGIFLLLTSGYIGISFWHIDKLRLVMAVLFGIGAALTIDEFSLWLYLQDVYWAKQGRNSIDLVVIATTIFSLVLLLSEVHSHKWIKKILTR